MSVRCIGDRSAGPERRQVLLGIGSGGVGQSLFTAHLDSLLGRLHSYIGTNVYYSDEEMRKQADQLFGCAVVTGQGTVQGSSRRMREDIFKKHISGDPIPARLPYAIITKQIELVGWKRLELNSPVVFQGVTSGSFDSMFRRNSWMPNTFGPNFPTTRPAASFPLIRP